VGGGVFGGAHLPQRARLPLAQRPARDQDPQEMLRAAMIAAGDATSAGALVSRAVPSGIRASTG
jgi:hypothetical protein